MAALVASVAAATPAEALEVQRRGGVDRFATAAAVAEAFPVPDEGTGTVFVVGGLGFADALAAAPAAARRSAPVLLVAPGSVPAPVLAELARLRPATVVVVGGTAAVDQGVVQELARRSGAEVERWSGPDRFATAAAVAAAGTTGTAEEVLVASGEGYADALAAGAAGAVSGAPLLLTARDALPTETREALVGLAPARITVVGGTASVSAAVEAELGTLAPGAVVRLAGSDRYATAAAVALSAQRPTPRVLLASGVNFPDALAGAALGEPLLLSRPECLPATTADAYAALGAETVTGLGGTAALSDAALAGAVCQEPASPPPSQPPPSQPPPPEPAVPSSPGDARDCGDFTTWRQAQDWFETYYPAYGDVARLDADGDLVACESLPGAP